jgi:2-keto-4-pentenoate hydratase/2-oxohepta-3-ene-1,7-dioic acid hydratase in catechol pathway
VVVTVLGYHRSESARDPASTVPKTFTVRKRPDRVARATTEEAMRFCVFRYAQGHHLGCAADAAGTQVVDLTAGWPRGGRAPPCDVADLAALGDEGLDVVAQLLRAPAALIDAGSLALAAPIPRPRKNVFCVGRNYREHIVEGNIAQGRDPNAFPEYIELFTKAPTAVIGPGAEIPLHDGLTAMLDYEAELAIVIGSGGTNLSTAAAMDAVFGYTVVNDVTARDLQRRHGQWFKGKSLDGTCPMGPWVVHRSAVPDPHRLSIRLWVNGELRQDGTTASMLFRVPDIVRELSAGLTLEPGDVIATGTPSGVGYAMTPPRPLKHGDRIAIDIAGIGRLENVVKGS